ncbi:maestro heat-like repeat-containing protein family member 1 isoform X1 [Tachysurus fulvidraco]|uniref:maestro heat-like repeat-containing protein family member 1 isoform X1 n=1 Tax=Tachysurus fulvidraco TaxID=1234273 RepID=UPI001FEF28C3|nr:maestro heat-like repeat-containing protein family member 1 isoform X1 [Tachysurus fulvidraco]XP_047667324.1 maestro heat-like repeat-containing protein family member 1 isoform X1 [Tachysurus fulvidraco]
MGVIEESDLEQVTLALLDAANDKDVGVQEQVRKSILTLGNQQPDKVLSMCQNYLLKHSKLVAGHRVVVLKTIELVVKSKIEDISYPKLKTTITLASDEMTRSKEVVNDWQQTASDILVAVGNKYINEIMEDILGKFQPGVLPHYFVVQTLASLSDSNVYGMVPFLSAILGTMLPMLGLAKQDNMKWVFSSALSRFSESILEYLANLDKAPDPTVRKDTFSSEIYAAYDILFNSWLQSRDAKLRLTVAEALGLMSHLMPHDKLEEQLPKLLPAILSLYKKNPEHYIISKSLCQILEASVNISSRVLETQMDSLLVALHQQVCTPVDYSNPPTVKNHNEILRCFTVLAKTFPDRLMVFVLQRLENNNERNRISSLAVLRHLINSTTSIMENKKLLILASMRQPLADNSNKVKKSVVQVISAMAHHGYLELEGGDILVRFIIQHCALQDTYHRGQRPLDPEEVTNEALRSMCDDTLHLFSTTVGHLTDVLWPMLLCYLTPSQYFNATTPLCKSLILLANKKRSAQEQTFTINFSAPGSNIPSPHMLMIRLLVNAAFPFSYRGHGSPSLSLLNAIGPSINPKVEALWESEIPKLLSYLEEFTPEDFDKRSWEDGLLRFLSKTLVAIDDGQWSCQLVVEATRYLPTYNHSLEEKSFLYKCIGVALQQSSSKELVKKQLQEILISTRHNDATERAGVAIAVGLCASSHLDGTLAKLEEFGKSDTFKKASGIFSLLKDKNDVDVEKMKSTLILCYGYVALNAPVEQLLIRLDNDILRNISKLFNTKVLGIKVETKDLTMKLSLIQSIGLIAKAINNCVHKQGYVFTRKQELVGVMMDFIKAEPVDALRTPVRQLVMTTCANLNILDPPLAENETFDMLKVCINGVFGLPSLEMLEKTKDEELLDPQEREVLYASTFSALHDLLCSVLARDLTPDGIQTMFKHIESWLSSKQDHERERAVRTVAEMLNFYLDSLNVKTLVTFHNLGSLLGRLAPRCTDPNAAVRRAAIDCIYLLLHIQLRYEGFSLDYKDDSVESLTSLREQLNDPDPSVLYKTCSELTKIISKRLPQQQLNTLIFMLFEGLVDSQSNCARASSVILNTLLKNRGAMLQDLVPEMLEELHSQLQVISEEQVKVAVAQSILILATQHLQTVINTLISYPLPFDSWISEMWIALGADSTVARQIMEMIMEKLNVIVPYVDKKESILKPGMTKVATNQPLAMTCALREMMLNGHTEEAVVSLFPQLFSALLVRIGSSVGVQLPRDINSNSIRAEGRSPSKSTFDVCGTAVEALRILLARAHLDVVVNVLDQDTVWDKMKDPQQHTTGVTLLSRAMAKHAGPRIPAIVESMCPLISNIYECQRITVTAFFSELLNHHVVTELMMIDVLMNNMMERISDPCCTVRMLAIRGLGNIATGSPEKVNKYAKELLAAMSSGMEEKDDPGKLITLEAMSGMSKVLLYLDERNVHMLVVYIFMKIKPFLENENDEIRCASIMLLGNLSKFGSGEPVFKDQIHNVLVGLLLHLSDPSTQVVKACKYSMRVCAPVLGSEMITNMFQNHLHEEKSLHYGEFINDLVKYLIQDFPGMLNFYHVTVIQFFKSNWAEIRASAAMFIGFLLRNLPDEHFSHINMGIVTKALVMLLQDPDPLVRAKAAEAMGHFH